MSAETCMRGQLRRACRRVGTYAFRCTSVYTPLTPNADTEVAAAWISYFYAGLICLLEKSKVATSNHHFRRADDKDTTTQHRKFDVYQNISIV